MSDNGKQTQTQEQTIDPNDPVHVHSINEPPGSDIHPDTPPPETPENLPAQPPEEPPPEAAEIDASDPDVLEEELEEAEDEGDVTVVHHVHHRGRPTTTKGKKGR